MVLCSYVNYIDQGLSTFFKKRIFESVLSDVNYEYLLIMLCEIIDRIGFEVGGIFENFKNFLEFFLFKKLCYFWVWRLFFGVWGGFDVILGLGVDIEGFVFCCGLIFELF